MSGRGRVKIVIPDDFVSRYNSGEKIKDLAKLYCINTSTVNRWARSLSLKNKRVDLSELNRRSKEYKGENNPAFGYRVIEQWDEGVPNVFNVQRITRGLLKKLKKKYGSDDVLANKLGICENTLGKAMRENNVWSKCGRGNRKVPKELLQSMYSKGFTLKKIGELLNIHASAIALAFHKYGIEYEDSRGWKYSGREKKMSLKLSAMNRVENFKWQIGLRERIRTRDGFRCFSCGVGENGKKHHVHHIFWDLLKNEDRHLVTLCHSCHMKTGRISDVSKTLWLFYLTKRLSEVYEYTYDDMIEGGELKQGSFLLRV